MVNFFFGVFGRRPLRSRVRVEFAALAFVGRMTILRTMRPNWIRRLAVLSTLAAIVAVAPGARAEEEFELRVSQGKVMVEAKGDWHINLEFPWKLVIGDTKLDKSKFTLTEKSAVVGDVPAGVGKLRGAVCSHDSCHTLEREVRIP
jgi:hypothetical protein